MAEDERRLLTFLKPENLKKFDLSAGALLDESISNAMELAGSSLLSAIPIGPLLEIFKELRELNEFKNANLDFILSLTILKKIANTGKIVKPPNCAVCNIFPFEIDQMSDEECNRLVNENELCLDHIVGRLDLRKRFRLTGKPLLKAMKELGNKSVFIKDLYE